MADDKPAQTPAPNDEGNKPDANPTPPQPSSEPEGKPAENKPAESSTPSILESLTDDDKAYLKGQGIEDLNSPEALVKIINHARSSQKAVSEANNRLNSIKATINPSQKPDDPNAPSAPNQDDTQQPVQSKDMDRVTAFNISSNLAGLFPKLSEDLQSGKFYQDMRDLGIPLKVGDDVNIDGMIKFGKMVTANMEAQAKIDELNKPGEGAIPDADASKPQQPDANAPMTKQMALAIMSQDKSHARFKEAQEFIQKSI